MPKVTLKKLNKIPTGTTRVSEWYDRIVTALDKCVFCDLKPKYVIMEQAEVVLTVSLFPYTEGHLLIIPRRHIERLKELTGLEWLAVNALLLIGVDLIAKALGVDDVNIIYREGGAASGKSLGHLHWHIMPMRRGVLTRTTDGIHYTFQNVAKTPIELAELYRKYRPQK